jgi:hypothetical protein
MRTFKVCLVTLAASAAILVPAASAAAAPQGASGPVAAASSGCVFLCFDLYEDGVIVGHDVGAGTAFDFCNGELSLVQLTSIGIGQTVDCGRDDQGHHRWVKRIK